MDNRAVLMMVKLLEQRKERAAMASRRARNDFLKAQHFSQQVDDYAQEYDQMWARQVVQGDQVANLQVQAAFTDRLQATAAEQRQEAMVLERESHKAISQAMYEANRLQALNQWLERSRQQRKAEALRREERAIEDVIQGRFGHR